MRLNTSLFVQRTRAHGLIDVLTRTFSYFSSRSGIVRKSRMISCGMIYCTVDRKIQKDDLQKLEIDDASDFCLSCYKLNQSPKSAICLLSAMFSRQ